MCSCGSAIYVHEEIDWSMKKLGLMELIGPKDCQNFKAWEQSLRICKEDSSVLQKCQSGEVAI